MSGDPIQIIGAVVWVVGNLRHGVIGLVLIQTGREIKGRAVDPLVRLGMAVGKVERAGVPMKRRRRINPTGRLRLKTVLRAAGSKIPGAKVVAPRVTFLHPQNPFRSMHNLRGLGDHDGVGLALKFFFTVDAHDAGIAVPGKPAADRQRGPLVTRAMDDVGIWSVAEERAGDGLGGRIHGLAKTGFRRLNYRLWARQRYARLHILDIRAPVFGIRGSDARCAVIGKGAETDHLLAIVVGIHFPSQRQLLLVAQAHGLRAFLFAFGQHR